MRWLCLPAVDYWNEHLPVTPATVHLVTYHSQPIIVRADGGEWVEVLSAIPELEKSSSVCRSPAILRAPRYIELAPVHAAGRELGIRPCARNCFSTRGRPGGVGPEDVSRKDGKLCVGSVGDPFGSYVFLPSGMTEGVYRCLGFPRYYSISAF